MRAWHESIYLDEYVQLTDPLCAQLTGGGASAVLDVSHQGSTMDALVDWAAQFPAVDHILDPAFQRWLHGAE